MMRRLPFILPLVLFAGLAIYFVFGLQRASEVGTEFVPSALIGKPFPEMNLAPLQPNKPGLKTADLKGQISVVNVFASWCVPCRAEHPMITRLAEKEGLNVIGLNYKDKPEDARNWLDELGDPYMAIGIDRDGRGGIDLGVYGVPETYVVDQEGIIRFRHVGPIQLRHLEDDILPLVEELSQ
ncbi:DsbE family thiol:disulfide interchange protein [Curvivirga aplysinae]|uniref:DsbE family thiol:disulfide interchange protein n=1 Tax=Curvivirga aplysinae TaxID=2529852 RepID=UPI002E261323